MSDSSGSNHAGDWGRLAKELSTRTIAPFSNAAFVIFVILGPILFGALGVWVEIFRLIRSAARPEYSALITATSAFYPALGCSTALQLVLASASKNDKGLISFALLMASLFPAAALILQSFSDSRPVMVLAVSAFCSVGAVWLWWITNGSDPTFMTPSPDAATGGQLDRSLPGSLSGFQA
jgi:hypothetical protein